MLKMVEPYIPLRADYVNGDATIAHNTATGNGGGIYLESTSELNCQPRSIFVLHGNTAANKGGGVHAISSSIKANSLTIYIGNFQNIPQYIGARINFINNAAKLGGGLSLGANAKFYILKYNIYFLWRTCKHNNIHWQQCRVWWSSVCE